MSITDPLCLAVNEPLSFSPSYIQRAASTAVVSRLNIAPDRTHLSVLKSFISLHVKGVFAGNRGLWGLVQMPAPLPRMQKPIRWFPRQLEMLPSPVYTYGVASFRSFRMLCACSTMVSLPGPGGSGARRTSRPPAARDKRKVPPDLRRQPTREGQRTAVESLCSDITQSQARARHFCVRPCARDISERGDRWRRVARCR